MDKKETIKTIEDVSYNNGCCIDTLEMVQNCGVSGSELHSGVIQLVITTLSKSNEVLDNLVNNFLKSQYSLICTITPL